MKTILPVLFAILIFPPAFSQTDSFPVPQTKSEAYSWLELSGPRTKEFEREARTEVAELLHKSPNLEKIESHLMKKFPQDISQVSEQVISSTRKILQSREAYESVLTDVNEDGRQVFFSTKSLRPDHAQIMNLSLSPSKNFLLIQLQLNGNIDVSRYIVYDLVSRALKGSFDGLSYMLPPTWTGPHSMITMHPDSSPRLTSVMTVDLATLKTTVIRNHELLKVRDWVAVTDPAKKSGTIENTITGQKIQIRTHLPFLNGFDETSNAFYYVLHTQTDGTIFRLKKENLAAPEAFIPPKKGFWLSTIQLLGESHLLVNYSRDSQVVLVIYDLSHGSVIRELVLPDNYDLSSAALNSSDLELTLNNFLYQSFPVTWKFLEGNPNLSNLPAEYRSGELEYVARLESFPGHDGELIPARITYLKSTVLTGKNPVYMESYGAFNYISGYLSPSLDRMKIEFLKRGGILVGTGIRGGAERGHAWYLQGTGLFKANPALDIIAIANGLVERGFTISKKIVSTGVSAGGDNVATAAQLSPMSFGLVIPVSGIHDAFGYLHMDRWGPQWMADYLNPYDSTNFESILGRAPLELRVPADIYPEYFIICGEKDTRVSKVHSYKLKASLSEFNAEKVYLMCVENSGHWPQESSLHGVQGVRTNAAIWARVFDYLELKF